MFLVIIIICIVTGIIHKIEQVAEYAGRLVSWLVLALVILTLIVAIPRYLLSNEGFLALNLFGLDWEDIRSVYSRHVNALNDSIQYVHAMIFMVVVSYAFKQGDHVRIDILYRSFSDHTRAWINVIGLLTLLYPTLLFILIMSWDYVMNAWAIGETSSRPGGLPYLYVLKSFLLIMPILMMIQASAVLLRQLRTLKDKDNT